MTARAHISDKTKLALGRPLKPVALKYGRWTPVTRVGSRCGSPLWLCRCDCGTEREVVMRHLRGGKSTSCGCVHAEIASKIHRTHGDSNSPEFRAWAAAVSRCHNSNDPRNIVDYQVRGIIVCIRWRESFEAFLADMGRRPTSRHSLDRINNDGNYEPGNCRWATAKEQNNNKRRRITTKTKLAAALLALGHIPYEDSKLMSADQIVSLFHFDHGILHAIDPIDEPWNLTPRLIAPHRKKSAADTATVAKVKRLSRVTAEASRRLLAKHQGEPAPETHHKYRWPQGRKLQSRGFRIRGR